MCFLLHPVRYKTLPCVFGIGPQQPLNRLNTYYSRDSLDWNGLWSAGGNHGLSPQIGGCHGQGSDGPAAAGGLRQATFGEDSFALRPRLLATDWPQG